MGAKQGAQSPPGHQWLMKPSLPVNVAAILGQTTSGWSRYASLLSRVIHTSKSRNSGVSASPQDTCFSNSTPKRGSAGPTRLCLLLGTHTSSVDKRPREQMRLFSAPYSHHRDSILESSFCHLNANFQFPVEISVFSSRRHLFFFFHVIC